MTSEEHTARASHWDRKLHESADLYRDASLQWGDKAQKAKAAEEFSELAAECSRDLNGQADLQELLEELVDARIMLEQLTQHITDEALEETVDDKLAELAVRVYGGQEDADAE